MMHLCEIFPVSLQLTPAPEQPLERIWLLSNTFRILKLYVKSIPQPTSLKKLFFPNLKLVQNYQRQKEEKKLN